MGDTHGEIVAGAGVLGTALAAFLAAIGWRYKSGGQPENGDNSMAMVLQRIAKLEQRADECDQRETDRHTWRAEVFGRLLDLDKKTSAILAILDERRHER